MHPHTRGRVAERLALIYYLLHGWLPAARPRFLHTQLDLVLTRPFARHILVVEVKYRRTAHSALHALGLAQAARQHRTLAILTRAYPQCLIRHEVCHLTLSPPKIHRLPLYE